MNDNELEEILNEIKNNKSHKKELDSEGFEDILNSLHSDDVQETEKVVEQPVKKAEKKISYWDVTVRKKRFVIEAL